MDGQPRARSATASPTSTGARFARRLVSAAAAVAVLAFGLTLGGPPDEVEAQAVGNLPAWVTLIGEFAGDSGAQVTDSVWDYFYPTSDWSSHIEWGRVDSGSRGTSGDRVTDSRRICHGPLDVDLTGVQFEVTWRSPNATGFIPCADLAPLFGAELTVELSPGGLRTFRCDLVYSIFHSGGNYIDCLTTDMVSRPSVLPETISLVAVDETAEFSIARAHLRHVRSGTDAEVQLQLIDSKGQPFAWRRMGIELLGGPSFDSGGTTATDCYVLCISGSEGYLYLSYRAASIAGEARRDDLDLLRVYLDRDTPGQYDPGVDPFRTAAVGILRPVNYVALGDSYSSGEAGRKLPGGTFDGADLPGAYLQQDDTDNPADPECRRWDQAYSQVLRGFPFGADLTVATYACTGAITYNVFRPDSVLVELADHFTIKSYTDRPSVSGDVPTKYEGSKIDDLQVNENWEPRQSVSLGTDDSGLSVDMVTVTTGGNDMRFSAVMDKCVRSVCSVDSILSVFGDAAGSKDVEDLLDELEERLVDAYAELKRITRTTSTPDREASVFVLGYPHLVPPESENLGGCDLLTARRVMDNGRFVYDALTGLSNPDPGTVTPPSERGLSITASERGFIRDATGWVNDRIRRAARRAGVHYVDITAGFEGHNQCSGSDWLNGVEPAPGALEVSDRSFHPNVYGHLAYADILINYIRGEVRSARSRLALNPELSEELVLTAAGLPVNPSPRPRADGRREAGDSADGAGSAKASGDEGDDSEDSATDPSADTTILLARPATLPAQCVLFVPGGQVTLRANGFAANSTVTLSISGVSATGTQLPAVQAPGATAAADGVLEVAWTVPQAPAAAVDPVPRWYFVEATGTAPSGGALVAVLPQPIVAYPDAAPCAVDDAAATPVGSAVRVAIRANDTAPTGGSLDPTSVRVESVHNGSVVVDSTDGSVTYTPEPGFVGADVFRYWVYDGWGIGVQGEVTVTVKAGCTISGTSGVVDIVGTEGDDVICVPGVTDRDAFHIIDAKGGNDVIIGGDGVDWIDGGSGSDTIYGRRGDDRIDGGSSVDAIYGGRGFDTIYSADLADTVHDDAGDAFDGYELVLWPATIPVPVAPAVGVDEAFANPGETLLIGVLDNDFDPDDDIEASTLAITVAPTMGTAEVVTSPDLGVHVRYTASSSAGVDTFTYQVCDSRGECSAAEVGVTVGTSTCTIVGTEGDDVISGTSGDDVICGLGGDDVIYGLDGDDVIVGGTGNDTLYGGNETRIGVNDGDDTLFGGAGDDTLYGGNGNDTLWGGAGDDTLEGNRRDDVLHGGAGVDTLNGGGEGDTLWGGSGDDDLTGHAANDTLHGGLGDDTLNGGNGDDTLWGGPGDDDLTGGAGSDTLWGGPGVDTLYGNTQNDILWGGPGDDVLRGGGHDDQIHGDIGGDMLRGDAGDDWLFGGWGADVLDGGDDADYLHGGDDVDACRRGEVVARCES